MLEEIDGNIVNHLYVTFECTHCLANISVSLGQLEEEADVECAECGTEHDYEADNDLTAKIEAVSVAYGGLAKMLHDRHMPLHFNR